MAEFFFNFKDLTNIQDPNKQMLNLSSLIISDDYIKKLFPKRYNFYMKFVDGFSSPSNLYKYLYRTKESKNYYQDLQDKLAKISNSLSKLSNKNKKKLLSSLHTNFGNMKNGSSYNKLINVIEDVSNKSNMKGGADNEEEVKEQEAPPETDKKDLYVSPPEPQSNENENENEQLQLQGAIRPIQKEINEDYLNKYYVKKSFKPMEMFLNDVKKIAPVLNLQPPKTLDDLVKKVDGKKDEVDIKTSDITEKADELQQLYKNYLKNPLYSPERLEVNIYDRITFIAITYVIRFITLQFIYWCLNSNIINNFTKAFTYYIIIYIIFFIFMISIVNVMYFFPILELFSNISAITFFPNTLYYFYVYTNGYTSLLIHMFIIVLLLFVPLILVMDKKDSNINDNDNNISYDYKKKNEIYISISNFSLIIWVLTSIISLKF